MTIEPESQIILKVNDGVAGKVLSTVQPQRVVDITNNKNFVKYDNWRDECISLLVCIPLKRGDTSIGIMNLVNENVESLIKNEDLDFIGSVATHISMIVQNEGLHKASFTDEMTGLYNNRYFQNKLSSEIQMAKQRNYPIGLLMFDIDHF